MHKKALLMFMGTLLLAWPAAASTSLGTGTGALLGGDLTDPENDIDDNAAGNPPFYGTGYNFLDADSSSETYFSYGGPSEEAALDVFDNKLGGNEAKWCCVGPPQYVAVLLDDEYVLTHFTISSGNDVANRDPDIWYIEGSIDGSSWFEIFSYDNDGVSPFTQREEVIRYDVNTDFPLPPGARWIRYRVESVVSGGEHQLGELEYFGVPAETVPATDDIGFVVLILALAVSAIAVLRHAS